MGGRTLSTRQRISRRRTRLGLAALTGGAVDGSHPRLSDLGLGGKSQSVGGSLAGRLGCVGKDVPLSSNSWYLKLLELTDALVRHAHGRYPVTQTLMRGPADLAVALRGHERFCLDLYDQPEPAGQLAQRCTDIWIQVAQAHLARIPAFHGGYTPPRLEVWAPGSIGSL